ncbi:MAG: VWA domain-containing protein [Deltaproteobacteria bacterium]|nr:VWA domain-containing protein [Deltaproteobacteria bacterium]
MNEILHGFVRALRRAGLRISPAETVDAFRAALEVGLEDRSLLRAALVGTLAKSRADRERALESFDLFFSAGSEPGVDLQAALRRRGASDAAIAALRGALGSGGSGLGALLGGAGELERRLRSAGLQASVETMQSPLQIGIFTHRMLAELGWQDAADELVSASRELGDLLGDEAEEVALLLRQELDEVRRRVRDAVGREFLRQHGGAMDRMRQKLLEERDFASMGPAEARAVRDSVRLLAQKLRSTESLRRKRERRGRFDPRRTIQKSLTTSGVPIRLQFRKRRRERPRLVLLCDISDSVKNVARLMLELVHAMQDVFARTRSFVFVSEIGEATDLFARYPVERAMGLVWSGEVVNAYSRSDYGRALGQFEARFLESLNRRTTVVVLGDGRNNHQEPRAEILARIRRRSSRLLWLTPEPRAAWGFGDSAMHLYAPHCTGVYTVRSLATLRTAVDAIVRAP